MLRVGLLLRVQVHLEQPAPVGLVPRPLANNVGGKDQVLQQPLVDGGEGARAGALLRCQAPTLALGRHDPPLRKDNHVLARELLLQLPHQSRLHLVVLGQQAEGHEDDNGALTTRQVHLLGARDGQLTELRLELRRGSFQVHQRLRDALLQLGGGEAFAL